MTAPEVEVVETDLLILGGGMAGCGAAFEAGYWGRAKGLRTTIVEKAAVECSEPSPWACRPSTATWACAGARTTRGFRPLRAPGPDGALPRGPRLRHRPPRGLVRPPVRGVGPAHLQERGRHATSARVAGRS